MNSGEILIRECCIGDLDGVSEVCCRCGYGGEDIAESGAFDDRRLFAMLFSHYYVRYESHTSFVAVPASNPGKVLGYVLGCPDTARYERLFFRRMIPRIATRVFFFTWWRYPRTVAELLRWAHGVPWREANPAGDDYPAHLHIDLLPEFQRKGIGGRLLDTLESRFRALRVPGIHLVTSSTHQKALPFYAKHRYRILRTAEHKMWSGIDDYTSIVYVKKLEKTVLDMTTYP
jgi:GNAT superfamily N-acetyltransferase